jgi:tricorn protease
MRKLFFAIFYSVISLLLFADEARLLRFPAISNENIIFTYAGDLYIVSINGGESKRLTSSDGFEMFARFSPDGKFIAYSAQYDGNTEIYLLPVEGGEAKRLTYTATLNRDEVSDRMGPNNITMGFSPDGKKILFRTRATSFNDWKGALWLVNIENLQIEELPLTHGGFASFSPDGKKLAMNRVFREFRTWKKYRGGQADDIWIFDLEKKNWEKITDNYAQDIIPMWGSNGKIYFISDRDENKRMNLYEYDPVAKTEKKLTDFKEYDIKFPSIGPRHIVFENAGYIYKYDIYENKLEKVNIKIASDFSSKRRVYVNVSSNISSYDISRDGNRVLFSARGNLFAVPKEKGSIKNLTLTQGVHNRNGIFSPDGKYIAYISDKTGEDEIYIKDIKSDEDIQLTFNSFVYKFAPIWSPDSKKILWSDRELRLRYIDIQTKKIVDVDKNDKGRIWSYVWSPDSRFIAYVKLGDNRFSRIYIYSLEEKKSNAITEEWFSSYEPEFSADGKYLFFVSDRDFNPIYGRTEWNHVYVDMAKIYAVTLNKNEASPFSYQSDEIAIQEEKKEIESKDKSSKDDKKEKKEIRLNIDFDGIQNRIVAFPVEGANYFNLSSSDDKLFYLKRKQGIESTKWYVYDLKNRKETELGEIDNYKLSFDKKKTLVVSKGSYYVIDIPTSQIKLEKKLNLSEMKTWVDKRLEWKQIYNESWRQMRDFFYAPNMHGLDWISIKKKYEPLLEYVAHRADLTYIIGEMIGELNAGHAYVGGGDLPKVERIKMGLLGAKIVKDAKSSYFVIQKILKGQNWDKKLRSPLTEIGVKAKEGDFILAIDGIDLKNVNNIYELLIDKADKQIELTTNSKPDYNGSQKSIVVPTDDESGLYYFNWVQRNIEIVNKMTNGRVGYLHIPNMGVEGLNEFAKYFYPQLNKEALIIDDRGNGGGNVSPMIIDRLRRQIAMISMSRNTSPRPNPSEAVLGPMVVLIDEYSASDGDIFPYRFKHYNLGKVIGKRSWGGVIGISGSLPFLDGGYLNKPEFAIYSLDGKEWLIENYGVDPDIEVHIDPYKDYFGEDAQLLKAIETIMQELETKSFKMPPIPPYPDRR